MYTLLPQRVTEAKSAPLFSCGLFSSLLASSRDIGIKPKLLFCFCFVVCVLAFSLLFFSFSFFLGSSMDSSDVLPRMMNDINFEVRKSF